MAYQIPIELADKFKIRPSAISDIMGGSDGITEAQLRKLNDLLVKQKTKPLTQNQQSELLELTQKFNAKPELSSGAKTYCQKWLKESIGMYNRRNDKSSNSKTEKGLIVEDHAIDFIAEAFGLGFLLKNEKKEENDYMKGCCDVDVPSHSLIIDNKSSWDYDTFPIFDKKIDNSGYEKQLQGYMELYDRENALLVYTLMDTPENIIKREASSYCYKMGYGELTKEIYDEFVDKMTYSNLPKELRIKKFSIKRDREFIKKVENRVKMCRKYLKELITETNLELQNVCNL